MKTLQGDTIYIFFAVPDILIKTFVYFALFYFLESLTQYRGDMDVTLLFTVATIVINVLDTIVI